MGINFGRLLRQDVTYWAPSGQNRYGEKTYTAPTALKGHWQEQNEVVRKSDGTEITSRAVVYLNADVKMDGWLVLGTINTPDPTIVPDAWEIQAFRKVPDIRAADFERKAYL